MDEAVNTVDERKETKVTRFMNVAKDKLYDIANWYEYYKEDIKILAPVVIGGTLAVCKAVSRASRAYQEKRLKDLYIYDRSMGKYIRLKRRLTQKDLWIIAARRSEGERLINILLDMNLV